MPGMMRGGKKENDARWRGQQAKEENDAWR